MRIVAFCIRLLAAILGMRELVVIHCDFYSADFVGALGESANVYDCTDDHAAFSWADLRTRELEDNLCRRSDLVLAVSEYLVEARKLVAPRIALVPNAAEIERFAPNGREQEPPSDIKGIPSPVLGYIGTLFDWVDFALLAGLARAHGEWEIALIGPVRAPLDALNGLRNVHVLGPRPYETIPEYLRAFDVALVPFKVNRLTQAADLLKVYEYLAAGIPVVSTDLPTIRRFGSTVRIGHDVESFAAAVRESLGDRSEMSSRRRRESVQGQDWSSRARLVDRLLGETLAMKHVSSYASRARRPS